MCTVGRDELSPPSECLPWARVPGGRYMYFPPSLRHQLFWIQDQKTRTAICIVHTIIHTSCADSNGNSYSRKSYIEDDPRRLLAPLCQSFSLLIKTSSLMVVKPVPYDRLRYRLGAFHHEKLCSSLLCNEHPISFSQCFGSLTISFAHWFDMWPPLGRLMSVRQLSVQRVY